MQVVFSCIDYKDPSKPFYFFVKVNEDRSYSGESIISKFVNAIYFSKLSVINVLCIQ